MKRRTLLSAVPTTLALASTPLVSRSWANGTLGWGAAGDGTSYLSGNFGPVSEEVTAFDLPVVGNIPAELNGRYLRNGPNPIGEVDVTNHHWFVGDGMVHGVRLGEGKALWYRNRWVRSEGIVNHLGEEIGERRLAGANNTHVIGHANRTWAIVESGAPPVELTYDLDTVGANNFFGSWPALGFSAHPKVDPDTGDLHAMCYSWPDWQNHVKYVCVGKDGRVQHSVDIPVTNMPMMHDMSLTKNYVVIYDLPVTIDMAMAQNGRSFPFAWNADHEPRVGLLPRDGEAKDVIWCAVNGCYVFHPMNAYEDDAGNVVADVCRYERMFDTDNYGPFGDSLATLDRWTINPTTRQVKEDRVHEKAQEFPRIHPELNSKRHRYGYSVGVSGSQFPNIYKIDFMNGEVEEHALGAGRSTGEAYFVPREGASGEDDGYLLSYVYDRNSSASVLLILDAQDFSRAPLAKVLLPGRVPFGFHGSWVPDGFDGPSV